MRARKSLLITSGIFEILITSLALILFVGCISMCFLSFVVLETIQKLVFDFFVIIGIDFGLELYGAIRIILILLSVIFLFLGTTFLIFGINSFLLSNKPAELFKTRKGGVVFSAIVYLLFAVVFGVVSVFELMLFPISVALASLFLFVCILKFVALGFFATEGQSSPKSSKKKAKGQSAIAPTSANPQAPEAPVSAPAEQPVAAPVAPTSAHPQPAVADTTAYNQQAYDPNQAYQQQAYGTNQVYDPNQAYQQQTYDPNQAYQQQNYDPNQAYQQQYYQQYPQGYDPNQMYQQQQTYDPNANMQQGYNPYDNGGQGGTPY